MPRKKTVDYEKLLEAVKSGMTSKEIMNKFNLKTSAQLKSLYLDALTEAGQVTPILGRSGRGTRSAANSKEIVVNKRGSLVIPRDMVDEMGFQIDDCFSVRKTKSGVSLKKL